MQSALRLLERDGVLAGLNMQEVADEAGVNRGLIHHYFGSRQALLRAALDRAVRDAAGQEEIRKLSPYVKGTRQFRDYVANPGFTRLIALLALDGDDSFHPIPNAEERLEDYERERLEGAHVADIDIEAALTVWDSTVLGYSLIREAVSRQLDIPLRTLDRRVLAMLGRQWQVLRGETAEVTEPT